MFVRVKKVGNYQYLQIAENRREGKRVKQTIIATLGRLDKLTASGGVAPFQWTVKGLGFMQRPGGSSRRRWGIADQGPGDDDGGDTIPR